MLIGWLVSSGPQSSFKVPGMEVRLLSTVVLLPIDKREI